MRIIAALAASASTALATTAAEYEFMQYIVKYGKSYGTIEEFNFRLENFLKVHAVIEAHNSMPSTYRMGHNKFSDWSEMEWNRILKDVKHSTQEPTYLQEPEAFAPIDWILAGAVNPIQDQSSCGSCWAFSATAGLEGAVAVKTGTLWKYAEQLLVDCSTEGENSGCGGGMAYDAYDYYIKHGPMLESEYPYTAKDGVCQYNSATAQSVRTTGHVTVPFDDIPQMQAALAIKPLNVSIYASAASFRNYQSGIYNDPTCGNQHNHATNVVGMGELNGIQYWVMRNSWGTDWGDMGYMKMQIVPGDGQCGVQMWPIYPTLA